LVEITLATDIDALRLKENIETFYDIPLKCGTLVT
jgi:hypothetical protein